MHVGPGAPPVLGDGATTDAELEAVGALKSVVGDKDAVLACRAARQYKESSARSSVCGGR